MKENPRRNGGGFLFYNAYVIVYNSSRGSS